MRIFKDADYLTMPWKNGGGSTTQLAIAPQGAGLDDFAWRISTARVETAGTFSRFPGVDRSLMILQGRGLLLQPQDGAAFTLTTQSAPFVFPGEQAIFAQLPEGPIVDFNVMTRRAAWTHELQALQLNGAVQCARCADLMFIHYVQGQDILVRCMDGRTAVFAAGDAMLIDRADGDHVELFAADALLCIAHLTFKGTPDGA